MTPTVIVRARNHLCSSSAVLVLLVSFTILVPILVAASNPQPGPGISPLVLEDKVYNLKLSNEPTLKKFTTFENDMDILKKDFGPQEFEQRKLGEIVTKCKLAFLQTPYMYDNMEAAAVQVKLSTDPKAKKETKKRFEQVEESLDEVMTALKEYESAVDRVNAELSPKLRKKSQLQDKWMKVRHIASERDKSQIDRLMAEVVDCLVDAYEDELTLSVKVDLKSKIDAKLRYLENRINEDIAVPNVVPNIAVPNVAPHQGWPLWVKVSGVLAVTASVGGIIYAIYKLFNRIWSPITPTTAETTTTESSLLDKMRESNYFSVVLICVCITMTVVTIVLLYYCCFVYRRKNPISEAAVNKTKAGPKVRSTGSTVNNNKSKVGFAASPDQRTQSPSTPTKRHPISTRKLIKRSPKKTSPSPTPSSICYTSAFSPSMIH